MDFDIVFSAISTPEYVVTPTMLERDREGFFQLLMDISLPRSIDPKVDGLEGVIRLDMGDIKEVTDASESRKFESIGTVNSILGEYLHIFESWAESHKKLEVVRELKERLYQMDYGKLLAFNTYNIEKKYTFIQKALKEAVLSIKKIPSRQSGR